MVWLCGVWLKQEKNWKLNRNLYPQKHFCVVISRASWCLSRTSFLNGSYTQNGLKECGGRRHKLDWTRSDAGGCGEHHRSSASGSMSIVGCTDIGNGRQ